MLALQQVFTVMYNQIRAVAGQRSVPELRFASKNFNLKLWHILILFAKCPSPSQSFTDSPLYPAQWQES